MKQPTAGPTNPEARPWWQGGTIYQVYPRSWCDSNGDGIGDLPGIISKLDYLEWLGVDGIWLNPIMPSPNRDWGYDVSDYRAIHPTLGSFEDFKELVKEARRRAISIVVDLVPSHTSDQHPWFADARSSRKSRYRDYYVWRPPGPGGAAPNKWMNYFGVSAWSLDEASGEYYLHNFSPHQPQLNWWNVEVRSEFDQIISFWLEQGVGGIRMDAVQALLYDRELRDNPPPKSSDSDIEKRIGQQFKYNANQQQIHDIVKRWRNLFDKFSPPRLLFGETWVPSIEKIAEYYGDGTDEFHLAWNLPFLRSTFGAGPLKQIIERTIKSLPGNAWPVWAMSTHDDEGRGPTRWCHGAPDAIRCALLLLLTLNGTSILYYGDEIGMTVPPSGTMDHANRDRELSSGSRDASRTPMQWNAGPGAGFSTSSTPWLPIGDAATTNVEAQKADRKSTLWLVHDLLALRRSLPDLVGSSAPVFVPSPSGTLVWRRGTAAFIAINLSTTPHFVRTEGKIEICTDRARDGEHVAGQLRLHPFEAVVLRETRSTSPT